MPQSVDHPAAKQNNHPNAAFSKIRRDDLEEIEARMLRQHGDQPPVHSLLVLAVRHAGAPTSRGAAAPVAEDAVAQPCEPPGRACVRTIGCLKQSGPRRRGHRTEALDDSSIIGSRRVRQRRRKPASTAALTWWTQGAGGRAVAAGTRRRSGVATGQRRRSWCRCPGSGVDGISFTVPPWVSKSRRIKNVQHRFHVNAP